MKFRVLVVVAAAAVIVLTAASLATLALLLPGPSAGPQGAACSVPSLPGSTVSVSLTDMGPGMMRGPVMARAMHMITDRASVPRGQVSFSVANVGSIPHELVVLPLVSGQVAGTRAVGLDGRIDEAGAVGEASASCAEGAGDGILPGTRSWVTLDLRPGRYELVCNYPGHYLAGMYAEISVS